MATATDASEEVSGLTTNSGDITNIGENSNREAEESKEIIINILEIIINSIVIA